MLKTIRTYTVVLFLLLITCVTLLHEDLIKLYKPKPDVQAIYNRLAIVSGTQEMLPLIVLNSPMVNAWTDGSYIVITKGMLDIIKNDDELAMVLAHEMGHVLAGDVFRGSTNPIDPRYLEANADKFGAFIMMRAGFDECKGKEIFRTFTNEFGDTAAPEGHPDNAFRLDQLDLPQCH